MGRWTKSRAMVRFAAVLAGTLAASTASAETDVSLGGILDVAARGNDTFLYTNLSMFNDTTFDALRARVFFEGGNERTRAFVQVMLADVGYSNFRFYGGYVQHKLAETHEIYLEAGKIPVYDGTWAPRTYSDKNPLVGVPFAYFYRSTLPSRQMPVDLEQLLSKRGKGQTGVSYTDANGVPRGQPYATMPLLYDNCWDYGAYALGATQRFDWAAGVTMGSPGAPNSGPPTNNSVGLHARVGMAVTPGLKLHVGVARGAYLADVVTPYLPSGSAVEDYAQMLYSASLEWGYRHLTVNSEIFFNSLETPLYAPGLDSRSGYFETRYAFLPGWYVAGRYDVLRFATVPSAAGPVTWDQNVQRLEAGVGYHVARELLVKVVGQLTETGSGWDIDTLLPAVQLSFRY